MTQIVFQIQIRPKNVTEIQNTKYILKVSKVQNTNCQNTTFHKLRSTSEIQKNII